MKIFVAGASGVIGTRLVPLLRAQGHQLVGMTRSPGKQELLRSLGALPVVCDVFDREQLRKALRSASPDVIIDRLTDLPDDPSRISEFGRANNRMRREGTSNLLAVAKEVRVTRLLAQSVAWTLPGEGGQAVAELERMVLEFGGVVLRYGQFYGPGTYHAHALPPPPRIQVEEAARRTVAKLGEPSGIVTITEPSGPHGGQGLEPIWPDLHASGPG